MSLSIPEILDELKKLTVKQMIAIGLVAIALYKVVAFVEERYAKATEIKTEVEVIRTDIKKINEEMKTQITTLSVLVGQMSAILNSGSGRVVQPLTVPHDAPPLTPKVLADIEAARPKVTGNEGAVAIQNDLVKQQAIIAEQKKRLKDSNQQ